MNSGVSRPRTTQGIAAILHLKAKDTQAMRHVETRKERAKTRQIRLFDV